MFFIGQKRRKNAPRHRVFAYLFVLAGVLSGSALAGDVTLAVAANFLLPAREIAKDFTSRTGTDVRIISGSSGKLTAMIMNGAPIDVFLSADEERPEALEQADLVAERQTYAFGRLALYAPQARSGEDALERLRSDEFRRLALAEPRLAPYGRAATEVLDHLDLPETVQKKVAIGENIGQTFGFVSTGNADLGLVALSQVQDSGGVVQKGVFVVPEYYHDPIRQDAVLLARAHQDVAARAFYDTLFEESTREFIRSQGYSVPAK